MKEEDRREQAGERLTFFIHPESVRENERTVKISVNNPKYQRTENSQNVSEETSHSGKDP